MALACPPPGTTACTRPQHAPSAAPPKFALARLLLEQRKSLMEALELAETVNRLTPKPEHYQLWLDVKNYID